MPAHLIVEEGPHRGLILNLEEGEEWIIGRDPDVCDLSLEDSTVSRKHVRLNRAKEGVYLKNLSKVNPALVNDEELSIPRLLKEGDRIQIGNSLFLFSEEAIPNIDTPAPKKGDKKGGYDDIFGDIEPPKEEEPEPEPELEPAPEKEEEEEKKEEEPKWPPAPPKPEMTAYDTIFEDSGHEEDIPFHLMPEAPLVLKVISGPNAGAEIGIERGKSYTIGKDSQSCDIVFQDMSVSRNHARLEVSQDGTMDIEDLGSKNGVAVNGSLLTEKKIVTPQDLIALGTTLFMIIDREQPQETIYSPVISTPETPPEEEKELDEAKIQSWKEKPIPTNYLVIGGSAAAIFLIMFITFFSLFKSKEMVVTKKEPISEIKEALDKFSDLQYSFNPGSGKLFLVGHVLTNVDYQEMKYRLSQIGFISSVEDNVVIDEGVWKMMNDVISMNADWRGVSIHSPVAGKFVVNGYIPTLAEGGQLYDYLTVNFPYLDRLENQIVIEETLDTQVRGIVTAANLGGITVQISNGNVVVGGNYNETRESEMKKTLREINGLKGVASVKNFAVATHPSKVGIDISGEYQVTGSSSFDGRGYSVVMNGKIYTLGDFVDGMKITAIETNTILLEKEGLKYKIDYIR